MDTQFDWLSTWAPQPPLSRTTQTPAPPHVSFGNNGLTETGHIYAPTPSTLPHRTPSADGFLRDFRQDPGEEAVPLSLQAHELSLEESKTYMRWYLDILARTNLRTIAISDVYQFLANFKISGAIKQEINRIFLKVLLLINIGGFFAVLRVVAHALQGKSPSRSLIKLQTGVPVPPSILSKKRQSDEYEEEPSADDHESGPAKPLDIDLFTEFMLTGERPSAQKKKKLKKLKSVKFSENVVSDVQHTYAPGEQLLLLLLHQMQYDSTELDYLLPMDQLLSRMAATSLNQNLAVLSTDNRLTSPDPEEKQILRDMEPQMNHFQHLHSVDTMLVDGVPANLHLQENSDLFLPRNELPQPRLLKPNMTGPAQMALMGTRASSENYQPLRPNVTGPLDMARFLPSSNAPPKISLQAFTSQMAGETADNTHQNAQIGQSRIGSSPPPVPATRRGRSASQPSPMNLAWPSGNSMHSENENNIGCLYPSQTTNEHIQNFALPVPPRSPLDYAQPHKSGAPPPPPPPRLRRVSNSSSPVPPPLPEKIPNEPSVYQNVQGSSSTTNILDDLKALQEEVDRIRDMTGGF